MNHKLALEIPDTLNTKIIRVEDYSDYNENIPVSCQLLEVTVPGFVIPVQFSDLEVGFSLNLNTCNLKLQTYDCDTNPLDLPDGIYIMKYSVSPRDMVYVEYNYLKVSNLMKTYKNILCETPLDGTEPSDEIEERLNKLNKAKMYIEAAKAKVEVCHDPKKGMELYNYAKKLLSEFDCLTCKN